MRKPPEIDIAALTATVKAPESLHRRVQEMVDGATAGERRPRKSRGATPALRWRLGGATPALRWRLGGATPALRWRLGGATPALRWRLGGAVAGLTAMAAALIVALTVTGGGSAPLTVQQATALTLSPATMAAPTESRLHRSQLNVAVEGVPFPYWKERFGWRSAGARSDRVAGRSITTVFYADAQGHRIGYAIVSGRAPATSGGTVIWHRSVPYRVMSDRGATVVAWPRDGHLCVVSGRDVSAATLLRLAGWSGEATSA